MIEFVLPVGNLPSGVSCHVYFNFSHLNSKKPMLHFSLQAAQASHIKLDLRNIKISTYSFKIFGIWPQTDRQTYIHTHTHAQCSHASVGLTQARPNYGYNIHGIISDDPSFGASLPFSRKCGIETNAVLLGRPNLVSQSQTFSRTRSK